MMIEIIGAESLGVRGLSCLVILSGRRIFIDPGIALGWSRHGLLPHPFQVAIGQGIKERMIAELRHASDVILSHFDGDHCPLCNPNPYQLGLHEVAQSLARCRIWAKGSDGLPPAQRGRRVELSEALGEPLRSVEGVKEGPLEFSCPVPHGQQGERGSAVMMSRIEENGVTFVHASDVQLLDEATTGIIVDWKPDIVIASGPPLYHYRSSSYRTQLERARKNVMRLAATAATVIVDHHLLRSEEGMEWLGGLKQSSGGSICCAAEYMKREPLLLEAWRGSLYQWLPVPGDWHDLYREGRVGADEYRVRGWEVLMRRGRIRPCKWYSCCPIKRFTEAGRLNRYWIENYCLVGSKSCIRYQMEERGEYHPDAMLPNGEIREDLS